jgi:hypothetical protein
MMRRSLTEKLRRIYEDPMVQRELMWLRAHADADIDSVDAIEREDRALRGRVAVLLAEKRPDLIEDAGERRAEFARLWHRRMQDL